MSREAPGEPMKGPRGSPGGTAPASTHRAQLQPLGSLVPKSWKEPFKPWTPLNTGPFPLSWEKAEVPRLVLEELMPKGINSWFPWCTEQLWHSPLPCERNRSALGAGRAQLVTFENGTSSPSAQISSAPRAQHAASNAPCGGGAAAVLRWDLLLHSPPGPKLVPRGKPQRPPRS